MKTSIIQRENNTAIMVQDLTIANGVATYGSEIVARGDNLTLVNNCVYSNGVLVFDANASGGIGSVSVTSGSASVSNVKAGGSITVTSVGPRVDPEWAAQMMAMFRK